MPYFDILILAGAVLTAAGLLVTAYRDPGMGRRQRVNRWVNSIGLCVLASSLVLFARTAAEWAAFVLLAVIAAWVLVVVALHLKWRIEQVRGLRADATLGVPATPTPMSVARALTHWIVWSLAGGTGLLMGVMLIGAAIEPELTSSVMRLPEAWKLIIGLDIAILAAAAIGVLIQKLARDEAVRYHDALTNGITAQLRAERAVGYGKGYSDALSGTAQNEGNADE